MLLFIFVLLTTRKKRGEQGKKETNPFFYTVWAVLGNSNFGSFNTGSALIHLLWRKGKTERENGEGEDVMMADERLTSFMMCTDLNLKRESERIVKETMNERTRKKPVM